MNNNIYKFGLLVSILILLGIAYYSYRTFQRFDEDTSWVTHSERVKASIESLSSVPKEISNEIRRAAITGTTLDSGLLEQLGDSLESEYEYLDSLTLDNEEQRNNLDRLRFLINDYSEHGDSIVSLMSVIYSLNDSLRGMIAKEENILSSILIQANKMKALEDRLLQQRIEQRKQSQSMAPLTLLTLTFIAIAVITLLFIVTLNLSDKNAKAKNDLENKVAELDKEIEQRSQLEKLLRNVLDSSSNGIMAFDSVRDSKGEIVDFKFTLVNTSASQIVGMAESEMIDSYMLERIPGNKDSGLYDHYKDVVETGNSFHTVQFYNYDGMAIWFDIIAVKSADGFVVTFSDVTKQKSYEEELLSKQQELEATNYELEQFAYIASHDLQEPLRKVRTFGDRLRSILGENLNEKGSDYLARMQNAAERMQVLIDDLLKFSRLSRADREFKKVDLNETLAFVKENLDIEIANKKASIESSTLPTIKADYVQFQQLFQNLISNALKYSKEEIPPKIVVNAESGKELLPGTKAPSKCWKITFTDNGIGFDPQYKEQIFVIFKRLHGRTEYSGSGIGLAICDKIVKNHEGIIKADSQLGVGSTFTIILPKPK